MKKTYFSLIMALTLAFASSCTTVPLTGRKQLNLIPASQVNALSFQQYNQVLSESKVSTNREWTNMVKEVGSNLSTAITQYLRENGMSDQVEGFQWEFNLLADDQLNAWAMPGGKVAFYEGIMPVAKDKNGVAVVMGHEIAHAIAKHGNERMSMGLAQQGFGTALQVALSEKPQQTQQMAMAAFGLGSQVGVMLPFSRNHEAEADRLGLIFMAKAGYDPRTAPAFWERMMAKAEGPRQPEMLSTHPDPARRIQNLQAWMPEAVKIYQQTTGRP